MHYIRKKKRLASEILYFCNCSYTMSFLDSYIKSTFLGVFFIIIFTSFFLVTCRNMVVDECSLILPSSQQTSSYQATIENNTNSTSRHRKKKGRNHSRSLSIASQKSTTTIIDSKINADHQHSIFSYKYWQTFFMHYTTSIYLENKGSVARDHLGM